MATIGFSQAGSFDGVGNLSVLNNPTSLQFGPDGRLYVAEQNGSINAFTVAFQNEEYVAIDHEELTLPNGEEVVKSIQNHNDDGSLNSLSNRQVTGIVVTGTAENPVLYVSSSDPRISKNGEVNLDTNSGVVTRVTFTGNEWEAVDIIRGLPRSEENHSVNGMVLSPDGNTLYLAVGGNTNNGAPSQFFSYTGEYALSGTVLEIDLLDLESRDILTDPAGGQNGTSRQYIYDLPTLDDPSVANNGVRETNNGLDVDGPWGGNDGFNMAILPADAPMRIYADGFRNHYDLVMRDGKLYTVDNGSNNNLGGNPIVVNGEATNQPNDGGSGDPEPLFLIEDGEYYGHPAPVRSNQDLSWTVYNDNGNPDGSVSPNNVPDLSALVPNSVNIQNGFIIDPSKFTDNPARLSQSGIRIERDSPQSNSIVNLGSSSNGLVEYTGNAFDGALQGALIVTQFNSNITLLNLNDAGTGLEPLVDPGNDGILGTADDEVIDNDGVFPLVSGQSQPLDVTVGPNGTIWVAEFGPDNIEVFEPDAPPPPPVDSDGDGLNNPIDPFVEDATNGASVSVLPGQTFLWDFDANQDGNLPGPDGFGGGLTGAMIDGVTDFSLTGDFFQSPSSFPGQLTKLDNVKFITAAGGGTTVVEFVSNGDPFQGKNSGEYLFHTGATIAPTVDTFTVKWTVFNPAADFTGNFQQIGGYIGTGDQNNYLKLVAIQNPNGELQVLLEDDDVVQANSFLQANDLFDVPQGQKIFFELEVDPSAATATPTISYETGSGDPTQVSGSAIDLSGTAVLDAIQGNYTVNGQTTGLAVGLLSSNTGQPAANAFQAVFDDIEIVAGGTPPPSDILYRVNAGGPQIAAVDGDIAWAADTQGSNNSFLSDPGSNNTASFPAVTPGPTVPDSTPGAIFNTERWDQLGGSEMAWAFPVPTDGLYEVRLFVGNGAPVTNDPGERIFDVAIEGSVPDNLDDVDLVAQFGNEVGGVISNTIPVTDGTLNIEFLHDIVQNPLVNGIEIRQVDDTPPPEPSGEAVLSITKDSDNVQASNFGNNSFQIENTGDKKIAQVVIDVTGALYPDTVFDPFGVAGDTLGKELVINTPGGTGVDAPSNASYIGTGGTAGFEGLQLTFDESVNGGFETGESIGFSVDMDPNSIAGADKGILDSGSDPDWDIGGVSGAELIGSTFTVTFTDGTTATGQLQGVDNQGGSQALASEDASDTSVSLTVNGLSAGGLGSYNDVDKPIVVVNGQAGSTARVVLTKGFIQPATNEFFNSSDPDDQAYAPVLQAQLDALAASDFPANNAVEFQTVDVVLTGEDQDISELFEFSDVAGFDFLGEDELPLGFVAGIIDPSLDNLPLGPVTQPIYLQFGEPDPELSLSIDPSSISENGGVATATVTRNTNDTGTDLTVSLLSTDTSEAAVPETVVIPAGQSSVTFNVTGVDDTEVDGTQTPTITATAEGFIEASAAIDVIDDEPAVLSLSIEPSSISENGGLTTATVTRNTDTTGALTVNLSSSDTSEAVVPDSVVIPAEQSAITFEVTGVDDNIVDGTQTLSITAASGGFVDGSATLDVTDDDAITTPVVEVGLFDAISDTLIAPIEEGAEIPVGAFDIQNLSIVATVSGDNPLSEQVDSIFLDLNNGQVTKTENFVPYALFGDGVGNDLNGGLIPLGSNSIALELYDQNGANGQLLDTFTANFTLLDEVGEPSSLTLSIDPSSISENGGVATATLTRDADTAEALTVNLSSSDTSEVEVPEQIIISPGQSSVTFDISSVDDVLVDGTQTATITAAAAGFTDAAAPIDITDDDEIVVPPVLEIGLYDAGSDTLIAPLEDGAVISESTFDNQNLAISAIVPNDSPFAGQVESIFLDLNNGQVTKTENVSPYALFGNQGSNFTGGAIPLGSSTIEFELYTQNGLNGQLLDTVSVDFTLV